MAEIKGVHHVALTVSDLARSAEWYERVFGGVRVVDGMDVDEGRRVTLLACGELMIGLNQDDRLASGDRFDEFRIGLDHIGFGCGSRADVEEWQGRLDELGIEHSGIQDVPYGHALVFRDPDNIQLEFFALPG